MGAERPVGTGGQDPAGGPSPPRRPARVTPMWLAHHYPDDYDRCVRVGWRHVCRRCLALYPLTFAVLALTYGRSWPLPLDVAVVAGAPLPAIVEFVVEHLGRIRHSPRRQVAVTVLAAVGLGRGLARYLADPGDLLFWSVALGYGAVGVAAAWARQRRLRQS